MEDERIRQLTEEVLSHLRQPAPRFASGLEARVAALEEAVRELRATRGPAAPAPVVTAATTVVTTQAALAHPSLQLVAFQGGGSERCVLEPDKPCSRSGACRTFGH